MIARALLAGAVALSLAACGRADRTPVGTLTPQKIAARVESAHLHRHLSVAPRTLDPQMNQDVPGTTVAQDLFEGLLRTDPAGNVVAGVAERWESSADGLIWKFHLRRNAVWSNGDPVTAKDFVYGVAPRGGPGDRVADGATAGAYRWREADHVGKGKGSAGIPGHQGHRRLHA